jgi:hypothetical protein
VVRTNPEVSKRTWSVRPASQGSDLHIPEGLAIRGSGHAAGQVDQERDAQTSQMNRSSHLYIFKSSITETAHPATPSAGYVINHTSTIVRFVSSEPGDLTAV